MVKCEKCRRFFFSTDRFQTLKYDEKELLVCPYCIKERGTSPMKSEKNVETTNARINMSEEIVGVIKFVGLSIDEPFHDDYVYNLYFTQSRLFGIYLDSYNRSHLDISSLRNLNLKKRLQNKDQELMQLDSHPEKLLSSDARNFEIPYEAIKEIRITKLYLVIFLKKPHNLSFIGDTLEFAFWAYSDKDKIIQLATKILPDKTIVGTMGFLKNKSYETVV